MLLLYTVLVLYLADPSSASSQFCTDETHHQNCQLLMKDWKCGYPWAYQAEPRIIGGHNTKINEFPWMACLKTSLNAVCFCGGSLISKTHVLTAAHCVQDVKDSFWIILGDHDLRTDPDCTEDGNCSPSVQIYESEKVSVHESFTRIPSVNDIALVKMKSEANFNFYVMPICLPFNGFGNIDHSNLRAAGWGRTKNSDASHPKRFVLQTIDFEYLPTEDCKEKASFYVINERHVCVKAGDDDNTDTVGIGDSGGPLMTKKRNVHGFKHHLFGVISYIASLNAGVVVSTRVSSYITWILDHM